jgi:hypothetical protein
MDFTASVRPLPDGRWVATSEHPHIRVEGGSRGEVVGAIRRRVESASDPDGELTIVVDVVPLVAGVAEAAQIMGWDKRRVITYIDRGRFPAPIQTLASGRIWLREDVERFAQEWHARRTVRANGGSARGRRSRADEPAS